MTFEQCKIVIFNNIIFIKKTSENFPEKIRWKFSEIFRKNMKFSGQIFRLTSLYLIVVIWLPILGQKAGEQKNHLFILCENHMFLLFSKTAGMSHSICFDLRQLFETQLLWVMPAVLGGNICLRNICFIKIEISVWSYHMLLQKHLFL